MEQNEQDELIPGGKRISRKKFLRACGSIVAGGTVLGVSAVLMKDRAFSGVADGVQGKGASGNNVGDVSSLKLAKDKAFVSPYKLTSSFSLPEKIDGMDLHEDKIFVACAGAVSVFDSFGKMLHQFDIKNVVRDIAVNDEGIFLLYPSSIEVYSHKGALLREWEACSELSDYCSFAVASGFVYATDTENKNICQYTTEGGFVRFFDSPNRFVIPSYTFGIEHVDGMLYCSNPGRHQVEKYSLEGKYLGSFGKPGTAPGYFTGCCNPVYLSFTVNGDIITSEKGDPRISCYSADGKFKNILLDRTMLGGGNTAYDIKVKDDKIFVGGKKMVSVFLYDKVLAMSSVCSNCTTGCPLREGVNV
jgi:hypothetical protein